MVARDTLAQHRFLAGIPLKTLAPLEARSSARRWEAGELVFRCDQPAEALYLLESGCVVVERHIAGHGSAALETLIAGDVLGISWLFWPYRWRSDARCTQPADAIAIDAASLRDLIAGESGLGHALALRLLRELEQRLERARTQRLQARERIL